MINELWNFLAAHKTTLIVAFGWLVREMHVVQPYAKANGGLLRVVRDFFWEAGFNEPSFYEKLVAANDSYPPGFPVQISTAANNQPETKTP
jgi:hypothetical protein